MTISAWLRGLLYAEKRTSEIGLDAAYRAVRTSFALPSHIRTEFDNGQLDYLRNYQLRQREV